jgi:hypothetical protein
VYAKILVLAVALALQGCAQLAAELGRDPRDAAWDPRPSQGQLFDQIPSWDDEAQRRCGSRLPEAERARRGVSRRC